LFCAIAGPECQLVVETHSDYILDRVRMDIRDKTTSLTHEDVSILYFEPGDLDVKIHSIRLDEYGNVLDAPIGYRKFFMEETSRSIGVGL
jgi:predicted ATPase